MPDPHKGDDFYHAFSKALLGQSPSPTLDNHAPKDRKTEAGLAVYRNNMRVAFAQNLRDTFPVIEKLVGANFFRLLAHEYFHHSPPRSQLARDYGRRMPEFLTSFEPAKGLPYLPDMARLELAWLDAYHGHEATPLTPNEIMSEIGAAPERANLTLHPTLQLMKFSLPIAELWHHNRQSEAPLPVKIATRDECVFMARPQATVSVVATSQAFFDLLTGINGGKRLGQCFTLLEETHHAIDPTDLLERLISHQLITDATLT